MKKSIVIAIISIICAVTHVHAHSLWINAFSLWINAFESHVHQPPHAVITLGWGHNLPLDDILNAPGRLIDIEHFVLYDPDHQPTNLTKPEYTIIKPQHTTSNFALFAAEFGAQKIAFNKDSDQGAYQISAASRPTCFTKYIDKNGKKRMQLKAMDQLDDTGTIISSMQYQAFAQSYITMGQWTQPKPAGHRLEIIPRTDLSSLHVGDLVEVEVLANNKPLNVSPEHLEFITAQGTGFGQGDGFCLMSYLQQGRARFRVQSAGQWMINVKHLEDVTRDGPNKELFGKVQTVHLSATLTFTVR